MIRRAQTNVVRWLALIVLAPILLLVTDAACGATAQDGPIELDGSWFDAPSDWQPDPSTRLGDAGLHARAGSVARTGGTFWHEAVFTVGAGGSYVLDFKNSSVIGRFAHYVFDTSGNLIARESGGIESPVENPFFLRHGRQIDLRAGSYRLVTRLESPFFLADPAPYLDTLTHYRQAVKGGNALVILCLGIFAGLGIYYLALAIIRRRLADAMYAAFIFGNLLYNGTALLAFHDLFGWRFFYLISFPILFSNIAYVLFVVSLLQVRPATNRYLSRIALGLIAAMGAAVALALLLPQWSLELDRYGVLAFLLFGLCTGVTRAVQGSVIARLYLVANIAFLIPGMVSISLSDVGGVYTFYAEHLGLIAVTTEVVFLALVMAYQLAEIQREHALALAHAEKNLRIATTDTLTDLPNRLALEMRLATVPQHASLTVIDLDGLKKYNDLFGHARGDELLRAFSRLLTERLSEHATLYRYGGDEFVIVSVPADRGTVEHILKATVEMLRREGFSLIDASFGTALTMECASAGELKHIADMRMYENKRERKTRNKMCSMRTN